MTEIRELEVTMKHNLLTGKSALSFASFSQREAFLVFFLFRILETTKPSHRCKLFWSYGVTSTYAIVCLPISKTLEFRHDLPNSGSLIIFFNLYF